MKFIIVVLEVNYIYTDVYSNCRKLQQYIHRRRWNSYSLPRECLRHHHQLIRRIVKQLEWCQWTPKHLNVTAIKNLFSAASRVCFSAPLSCGDPCFCRRCQERWFLSQIESWIEIDATWSSKLRKKGINMYKRNNWEELVKTVPYPHSECQ